MIAEVNEMYKEVNSVFNEKIKPVTDNVEKKRLFRLKVIKILNIIAIISILVFAALIFIPKTGSASFTVPESLNNTGSAFLMMFVFIVLALLSTPLPYFLLVLICLGIVYIIKHSYTQLVKKEVYPCIFKAIGPDLNYLSGKIRFIPPMFYNVSIGNFTLFGLQELISTFLFSFKLKGFNYRNLNIDYLCPRQYEVLSPDDVISGSYKGKPVYIVEFALYRYLQSKMSKFYQGFMFQTKLSKNFNSKVVIRQRDLSFENVHGMQKIELESNEFNKIYEVYAADQVEARYLLTTSLMEKMIDIHKKGQGLNLQIQNQDVTIVKQTREDMFEPDIKKSVNDVNSYYEVLLQTKLILDLITDLNLDRTTGL